MFERVWVLLFATMLAVGLFVVLSMKLELPVDNNSIWNGVCIMVTGFMVTVYMRR